MTSEPRGPIDAHVQRSAVHGQLLAQLARVDTQLSTETDPITRLHLQADRVALLEELEQA